MHPQSGSMAFRSVRTPLGLWASAGIACLAAASPVMASNKSWNTGNGSWGVAGNWSPNGVPGPGDLARIGDLPGISNGIVTLNIDGSVAAIQLSDGMVLRTNAHTLAASGATQISGRNVVGNTEYPSTLRVQQGAAYYDFRSGSVSVLDSGVLRLEDYARIRLDNSLTLGSGAELRGRGVVEIYGDASPVFSNDGAINVDDVFWIFALGEGLVDLDGPNGHGVVTVDTQNSTGLMVQGDGLTDPFGGIINLTSDSVLDMQLQSGWVAAASSEIKVEGILDVEALPPARIMSGDVTLAGDVDVSGFKGHLNVMADATLQDSAEVTIGYEDLAEFTGETTIDGGWYSLGQGAHLEFNGPTTVHGGTFNTFGIEDADGDVDFNGPTEWDGEVTFNGRIQQSGDAVVNYPTVINATLFDLDGDGANMAWDINNSLTINTELTHTHPYDFFSGRMDIGGSLHACLTVNLIGDGQSAWSTLGGVMNLTGAGGDQVYLKRIDGSTVLASGEWNIDKNVEIAADMIVMPNGEFHFAESGANLRVRGRTWIREDATFYGDGTIYNWTGADMTLFDDSNLGDLVLVNKGTLSLFYSESKGAFASVGQFTNGAEGTVRFRIGGPDLGEGYDHLLVTSGVATLNGQIAVDLFEQQEGFAPKVGDEFTVLTAAGGVSGKFVNSPETVVGPLTYKWKVVYGGNSVVLRLAAIDGCAADLAATWGVLDLFDFLAFVNYFNSGDPIADRDHNGVFDLFDFLIYVNEFNGGC